MSGPEKYRHHRGNARLIKAMDINILQPIDVFFPFALLLYRQAEEHERKPFWRRTSSLNTLEEKCCFFHH
jgi:hypothetical protein